MTRLEIRGNLATDYADVYTAEALTALEALAPLGARAEALRALSRYILARRN
mgnify:CR=1 FL=1